MRSPPILLVISATPGYVGPQHANNAVGFEVAAGNLGGALLSSLIGMLTRVQGMEMFGPFPIISVLTMAALLMYCLRLR